MICENCGQEMDFIEIDDFQRDGSDEWCSYPIYDIGNGFYIDATENWTGYGMSNEEMAESIRCPLCKKFPFKCKEVQTYDLVRLVMFKGAEREKE